MYFFSVFQNWRLKQPELAACSHYSANRLIKHTESYLYCFIFQAGGECTVSRTLTHDLTQYPPTTSGGSPSKARSH